MVRRAAFYTLGCRLNQAESDSLASAFVANGYRVVPEGEEADLCVINTCSVTEQADAKCRYLVRSILRGSPKAYLVVTGCYAQSGVEVLEKIPGIDLIVGTDQKMAIPRLVAMTGGAFLKQTAPQVVHTTKINRKNFVMDTYAAYDRLTRPNIKIQDGCDFFCSFCIIPFTRGRERSRVFEDVLREATLWAQRGHREVVLTGVNLGEYRDQGQDLVDLVCAMESIGGIERIRISSIEPTTVSERFLNYMAVSKKLCPYLHIPLQSGSDVVLSAMSRKYRVADYETLVQCALGKVTGLGLGTDVMVGFPGETEKDFQNTLALLNRYPFSYFHVFPYSPRKGTRAIKLSGRVPSKVTKTRGRILHDLSWTKRYGFYQAHMGKTVSVLFERSEEGIWTGLTPNYMRVGVATHSVVGDLSGKIHNVKVVSMEGGLAIGEVVHG